MCSRTSGGIVAQTLRITREYFLPDPDLRKALGLSRTAIILSIERKHGTLKSRGRDDQTVDLMGCLVTVFDPKETTP